MHGPYFPQFLKIRFYEDRGQDFNNPDRAIARSNLISWLLTGTRISTRSTSTLPTLTSSTAPFTAAHIPRALGHRLGLDLPLLIGTNHTSHIYDDYLYKHLTPCTAHLSKHKMFTLFNDNSVTSYRYDNSNTYYLNYNDSDHFWFTTALVSSTATTSTTTMTPLYYRYHLTILFFDHDDKELLHDHQCYLLNV